MRQLFFFKEVTLLFIFIAFQILVLTIHPEYWINKLYAKITIVLCIKMSSKSSLISNKYIYIYIHISFKLSLNILFDFFGDRYTNKNMIYNKKKQLTYTHTMILNYNCISCSVSLFMSFSLDLFTSGPTFQVVKKAGN